jgi:hypothetical protein
MSKMLRNLLSWLDQLGAHAEERSFDPECLVTARLYPDMFTFAQQIQAACDAAKFTAARLSGREAPSHPDTEGSLGELRERVASVLSYLEAFTADDLEGAEARVLSPGFLQGATVTAPDYLREFALPNFYFHLSMAYAILRSNGVPLGKRTWIGSMNVRPAEG